MTISKLAYELYKINWMRRISSERQMDAVKNFYEEQEGSDYTVEDWIFEHGYDGEIYVCEDEFLNAEYLDENYMKTLFDDNENLLNEYQKDLAENFYVD